MTVMFRSALILAFPAAAAQAIVTIPVWHEDPQTTYTSFAFTTNNPTAAPESFDNDYGTPALSVAPGPFASGDNGWRSNKGAWDLGREGTLTITIPISSAADASLPKNVEVFVNFIWYSGPFTVTPVYTVADHTPVFSATEGELVEPDGALGSWQRTVWSASFEDVTTDTLTLVMTGAFNGSVVDDVILYTRYAAIPEPGAATFLVLAAAGSLLHRRRPQRISGEGRS